jgi:membrane associated rhomboid family serine protease
MIPLKDTIPSRRFPIVNTILIGLNVLVFLAEVALGEEGLYQLIVSCGLVPAQFWQGGWLTRWWTPFTWSLMPDRPFQPWGPAGPSRECWAPT